MTRREAIEALIHEGWALIPITALGKVPVMTGWPEAQGAKDADAFEPDLNIGVLCGKPSNNLIDIDLDAHEAVTAAPLLLPATARKHGRPHKPSSHLWFYSDKCKAKPFKDIDGEMLIELRSTGGQTVVPPSVYDNGEALTWTERGAPAKVKADDLLQRVIYTAIAALFAQRLKNKGSRHATVGPVASFLSFIGIESDDVRDIMHAALIAAQDDELDDRMRYVDDTLKRIERGDKTYGGRETLGSIIPRGEEIAQTIAGWLGKQDDGKIIALNDHYFVTQLAGKVIIAAENNGHLDFMNATDFTLLHANKKSGKESVGHAWLRHPHRRSYRTVTFAPPPLQCPPDVYNTWKGFAVAPDSGADPTARCEKLLQHIHNVICRGNTTYFDKLLDVMARTVQYPGEPSGVAVILRGPQGIGKGVFLERAFGSIFGRHFAHISHQRHLTGNFNAHLSQKVVVFADEAVWGGDRREAGALKRIITERTLTIERKGFEVYSEPNCVHLYMATNEGWAYPAGDFERRGFILDTGAEHFGRDYFRDLIAEIDTGGKEAFLAYLLSRDIRDDWREVPQTDALAEQQERSADPVTAWYQTALEDGAFESGQSWPSRISIKRLRHLFKEANPWHANKGHELHFARTIQNLLPKVMLSRFYDARPDLPSVKEHMRGLELPSLFDCRRAYELKTGRKIQWLAETNEPPLIEEFAEGEL